MCTTASVLNTALWVLEMVAMEAETLAVIPPSAALAIME